MDFKVEKGITLIMLAITILIIVILTATITVVGISTIRETDEEKLISELEIIEQKVLEQYYKYEISGDARLLVGDVISETQINELATELDVTLVEIPDNEVAKDYRRLTPEKLSVIGVNEAEYTYIVNYASGEVINETVKKTNSGKSLYTFAKDFK